jgi:hypothetical protein
LENIESYINKEIKKLVNKSNFRNILLALHASLSNNISTPSIIYNRILTNQDVTSLINVDTKDLQRKRIRLINNSLSYNFILNLPKNKKIHAIGIVEEYLLEEDQQIYYDQIRIDPLAQDDILSISSNLDEELYKILKLRGEIANKFKNKYFQILSKKDYGWKDCWHTAFEEKIYLLWSGIYGNKENYYLDWNSKVVESWIT